MLIHNIYCRFLKNLQFISYYFELKFQKKEIV